MDWSLIIVPLNIVLEYVYRLLVIAVCVKNLRSK